MEEAHYVWYGPRHATLLGPAWIACTRRRSEECFQRAKNDVGLDRYQVRSWRTWYSHNTCPSWPPLSHYRRRGQSLTQLPLLYEAIRLSDSAGSPAASTNGPKRRDTGPSRFQNLFGLSMQREI